MTKRNLKIFKAVITGFIIGALIPATLLFLVHVSANFIFSENFFELTNKILFRSLLTIGIFGGIIGGIGGGMIKRLDFY